MENILRKKNRILKKISIFNIKIFWDSFDLDLTKKIISIEGPNKSGKTTLINIIRFGYNFDLKLSDLSEFDNDNVFAGYLIKDEKSSIEYTIQIGNDNHIYKFNLYNNTVLIDNKFSLSLKDAFQKINNESTTFSNDLLEFIIIDEKEKSILFHQKFQSKILLKLFAKKEIEKLEEKIGLLDDLKEDNKKIKSKIEAKEYSKEELENSFKEQSDLLMNLPIRSEIDLENEIEKINMSISLTNSKLQEILKRKEQVKKEIDDISLEIFNTEKEFSDILDKIDKNGQEFGLNRLFEYLDVEKSFFIIKNLGGVCPICNKRSMDSNEVKRLIDSNICPICREKGLNPELPRKNLVPISLEDYRDPLKSLSIRKTNLEKKHNESTDKLQKSNDELHKLYSELDEKNKIKTNINSEKEISNRITEINYKLKVIDNTIQKTNKEIENNKKDLILNEEKQKDYNQDLIRNIADIQKQIDEKKNSIIKNFEFHSKSFDNTATLLPLESTDRKLTYWKDFKVFVISIDNVPRRREKSLSNAELRFYELIFRLVLFVELKESNFLPFFIIESPDINLDKSNEQSMLNILIEFSKIYEIPLIMTNNGSKDSFKEFIKTNKSIIEEINLFRN